MPAKTPPSHLTIRSLLPDDCAVISQAFAGQGWNKPISQFQRYYQESLEGKREILVAELAGDFAGYLTIVWASGYLPFFEAGIPEIVDFNVLLKYRRQGVGTALMDAAERRIAEHHTAERRNASPSPLAGLGVGLTADYGPAQILYIQRGYLPDGRGLLSHGRSPTYGDLVPVDDALVLYMTKPLRPVQSVRREHSKIP